MNTIEEELKATIEDGTPAPTTVLTETVMSSAEQQVPTTQAPTTPEPTERVQGEINAELENQASAPKTAMKCKVIRLKKAKKASTKGKTQPKTFVEAVHKAMGKPITKISKHMIRKMPSTEVGNRNGKVIAAFPKKVQNEVVICIDADSLNQFMSMIPVKVLRLINEMVFYDYLNNRRWVMGDKYGNCYVEEIE